MPQLLRGLRLRGREEGDPEAPEREVARLCHRLAPRVALILTAALLTGCGSSSHGPAPPSPALQRAWLANARQLVATLETDVLLSAYGGANVATARRALANSSDVYGMVLAYTDFASCGKLLGSFGPPGPTHAAARRALGLACKQVEEAAAIFHDAMSRNDPKILLAATRAALAAEPLLVQARAELAP
jgi:hypothetical protein